MTYDMTKGLGYICGIDQDGGAWPIHSEPEVKNENVSTDGDIGSLVEEAEVGAWEEEIWVEGVTEMKTWKPIIMLILILMRKAKSKLHANLVTKV